MPEWQSPFLFRYSNRLIPAALGAAYFGIFNVVGRTVIMPTFSIISTSADKHHMHFAQGEGDENKRNIIFNVSIIIYIGIAIAIVAILECVCHRMKLLPILLTSCDLKANNPK